MPTVTIGRRTGDTFTGLEDTYLVQALPNSTNGGTDRVYVSCVTVGSSKRSIFRASGLSNLPTNAIVSAASLTLTRINAASPGRNYEVRQLLVMPNEAQATWNNRATSTPWQSGGASGASDSNPTPVATGAIPTGAGAVTTITSAAFIALAQGWIDGSITNNGVLILVENDGTALGGDFDYASGERSTNSQRPYLTVTYSQPITPTASISDVTVNNLAGSVTLTVSLSSDALVGGVSGTVNTADITAVAGVDYTAQVNVPFSIPQGQASGTITIPILP